MTLLHSALSLSRALPLSLSLSLSLSHSISFGELFGSLLLACLVRMVTELFGVWFPRSICGFHELGPGSIEAPVTCLAGGGGEVGTMRAGRRAMGAPQGNSGGPPPNPSSSTARGLKRWRWWGGDGERAIRERVRGKEEEEGADHSMAPGGLV